MNFTSLSGKCQIGEIIRCQLDFSENVAGGVIENSIFFCN